ncbi:MAG: hypothetical protein ACHP9V_07380, partial [Terriglobales bacterium]
TVLLGSTQSAGLPLDLFATGEPRWLGVKVELPGEVERPRVLLVSVPYALKASDADTVGGMPASAFVLAPTGSGAGANASAPGSTNSKAGKSKVEPQFTSSGTANYIPIFTDNTGDIGNSNIFQSTSGKVGIGYSGAMTANLVVGASTGGAVLNASNLVDQDMFVTLSAPGASDKHTYFGPSTPTNLTLGTGGVEKVRITNAGNVGIGYSNPQQRLVIGAPAGGTVLNATNLADQDLNVIVSAPGASDKHTYFGPSVATNLTLGVGLAEMMRITNAGRVGIGTSTPGQKLSVAGVIQSTSGGVMFPDGTTQTTASTSPAVPIIKYGAVGGLSQSALTWRTWTMTWGTPFPDANYAVNCSLVSGLQYWIGNSAGDIWLDHIYSKTSASVTVFVVNTVAYSEPFELDCTAIESSGVGGSKSGAAVNAVQSGPEHPVGVKPE